MAVTFSKEKLERTSDQIHFYREDLALDLPFKIHAYGVDDGHGLGGPPLHPEFENWLGPICFCGRREIRDKHDNIVQHGCPSQNSILKNRKRYQTSSRLRTTKAFRKLRRVAPREYDALWLMTAHRQSFAATLDSLNERAKRLGKPGYAPQDLLLLLVSGVDKTDSYW